MKKIIELDDKFFSGEDTVQVVLPLRNGRFDTGRMAKTASEALDYVRNVSPEPGKSHLLILALGGEEKWGPNRNGDAFSEHPVRSRGDAAKRGEKWLVEPGQELTKHFQSFETNPAHAFSHHRNKDPKTASGVVKKAFWNPRMSRVELLTVIDNEKDAEWIQRVEAGEKVATSMGCFGAGTMITMADGTRKSIEDILIGDRVLTHLGRARSVTEVHKRPYKGDLYTIRAEAHASIRSTAEHPFYATERLDVREKTKGDGTRWRADAKIRGEWTHASCLEDQFLLEPVYQGTENFSYLTRAFARLLGYYVAEGHIVWRNDEPYGVELTTNVDDAVHAEIEELCAEFGTRNKPLTRPRANSPSARSISINDDRLARMCLAHGSVKAKQKRLSEEVMRWPVEMQRELVGAYANGDGCGSDGWLKFSTGSDDLAWQWMTLLPRLGILASINQLTHKAGSGFSRVDTYEWVIHIGKQWAHRLRGVCAKVEPAEIFFKKECRKIVDQWIATPIREIDVMYVEMDVYNFEVEEDNSYVAGGLAVHNCKISYDVCNQCGNKAPTRADYCDHARYKLGELNDDGTKNFVYNPSPSFFDISRVFRPADRTSYTLKKVADVIEIRSSAELGDSLEQAIFKAGAARKLSDINKIIQGEPVATSTLSPDEQSLIVKFRDHAGDKLAKSASIPRSAVRGRPLRQVLAAANKAGVILKDAEFIEAFVEQATGSRAALPRDVIEKTAKAASCALELFAESPSLLDWIVEECKLGEDMAYKDDELDAAMKTAAEKRGYSGEYLYRRLVPEGVGIRPDALPTTDVLNTAYGQTNRGAALAAQDAVTRAHAKKLLGGAALTLGGYKMLSAFPGMKSPLARGLGAVGMGALGMHMFGGRPGGTIQTAEGPRIPDITEMAPKTAAIIHLVECANRDHGSHDLSSAKTGSRVDPVVGLVLDPDAAVDCLGDICLGNT